jgi:hypothetical protein
MSAADILMIAARLLPSRNLGAKNPESMASRT